MKEWPDALRACDAAIAAMGDPGRDDQKLRQLRKLKANRARIAEERKVAPAA
jgi:hypothetical protein